MIPGPLSYRDFRETGASPQNIGRAKSVTTLPWKNVTLDTLWVLVHSVPHRLENVRKHTGKHSGY